MNFLQELLEKYQVRKTKAQKDSFLSWAQEQCENMGYAARVEENKGSKLCRNLVVGNVENAQVVFTAHYDTCAKMPVPNLVFPKNFLLTLLVQMPLVLVMLAVSMGAALLAVALRVGSLRIRTLILGRAAGPVRFVLGGLLRGILRLVAGGLGCVVRLLGTLLALLHGGAGRGLLRGVVRRRGNRLLSQHVDAAAEVHQV